MNGRGWKGGTSIQAAREGQQPYRCQSCSLGLRKRCCLLNKPCLSLTKV